MLHLGHNFHTMEQRLRTRKISHWNWTSWKVCCLNCAAANDQNSASIPSLAELKAFACVKSNSMTVAVVKAASQSLETLQLSEVAPQMTGTEFEGLSLTSEYLDTGRCQKNECTWALIYFFFSPPNPEHQIFDISLCTTAWRKGLLHNSSRKFFLPQQGWTPWSLNVVLRTQI